MTTTFHLVAHIKNLTGWAEKAAAIRDLYKHDPEVAHTQQREMCREFVKQLDHPDAEAMRRELLDLDESALMMSGPRYPGVVRPREQPLREIQISGGPRDGELVAYEGMRAVLDGHVYELFRGRDADERLYFRYVHAPKKSQ